MSLSSGYHPQTNGQTERKIQELGRCLRSYCHDDQHSWSRFLPWAEYAQNSFRQDTTRLTPFKCVLGHQPLLFLWTGEPSEVPDLDYWFRARECGTQLISIFSMLCGGIRPSQIDVTPTFQPGDKVWLSTRHLRLRQLCRKLSPRYIGPFPIQRQINEVPYRLQLPPRYRIHPSFHVSHLKLFSSSAPGPAEPETPPPPEILDQPPGTF